MGIQHIRVIVTDDHPIVLDGMQKCLAAAPDIELAGMAHDFASLLRLLTTIAADVVVLDLLGMGAGPITMVDRLRRDYPRLAIVVFSSVEDLAVELMRAGVQGYVLKEDMPQRLIAAVRAAHRGEVIVSPAIAERLEWAAHMQKGLQLSLREHQVLRLLSQGLHTTAIADKLGIEPRTTQNHITRLRAKTGCFSRSELVEWYQQVAPQAIGEYAGRDPQEQSGQ